MARSDAHAMMHEMHVWFESLFESSSPAAAGPGGVRPVRAVVGLSAHDRRSTSRDSAVAKKPFFRVGVCLFFGIRIGSMVVRVWDIAGLFSLPAHAL